jgi:effector-binding domain-containing protein
MRCDVQVMQVGPQPIAVVRRRASSEQFATVVPEACGDVWKFIRSAQIERPGRNIAVYLDCEGEKINIEVGVEVTHSFTGDGEVVCSATPAGTVATTVHMGPYDRLGDAHAVIREWCDDHHHKTSGPQWEIYGHWNDDPSKLRTDVFYLLDV